MQSTKPRSILKTVRKLVITSYFVLAAQFLFATTSGATTIEVVSNHDGYLVSGGIVNYENYIKDRTEAANCENCFWKIHEICKSWDDSNHRSCPWLRLQCPADMQLVEVFRFNGLNRPSYFSDDWYFVGYSCIGDAGPISSLQIATTLLDQWLIRVPKLQIKYFPPDDAILRQPIKYLVTSTQSISFTKYVAGVKASLSSSSNLSFNCVNQNDKSNCASFSNGELKFVKTGLNNLTAKSIWNATFEVNGIPGIEINGSKPSSTFSSIINVHPLFTHLRDPKKGRP
jgi:hypothetical protein